MSIEISFEGKTQREREKLLEKIAKLRGTHTGSVDQLLVPDFMLRFTNFASVDEMVEKSGFEVHNAEDFAAVPADEWDQFIAANTQFATWLDMISAAGSECFARALDL